MELPWKGRSEVTVGGCPEGAATYGSPSPSLSRPGGAARIAPHCRTPVPPFQGGVAGEAPPYATAPPGPLHTVNSLLPLPGQRSAENLRNQFPAQKRASWKDEVPVLNWILKACVS